MKRLTLVKTVATSVMVGGLLLTHPFFTTAQETTPAPQGKPTEKMEMPGMMGHEHGPGMMGDRQKMHEQHEKMHQEMTQELQKQMAALRDHTKAMDGMSDEKQLLTEMKKHQQMTDGLLGTMVEQREKMQAQMKAHHERMSGQMGKGQQPAEEHEAHHDK
ncbi:MAG: hypothetical protein HOP18_24220 [Deltaproteobacteria bacterium]|nr:hypothetical protein [Deltaproteobacteria bacterium]